MFVDSNGAQICPRLHRKGPNLERVVVAPAADPRELWLCEWLGVNS
jgi:hypothetical protein